MGKTKGERPSGFAILDAATEALAPAPMSDPSPTDAVVDGWFRDHFPGSPVARVTGAWNHLYAALPDLKRRLNQAA